MDGLCELHPLSFTPCDLCSQVEALKTQTSPVTPTSFHSRGLLHLVGSSVPHHVSTRRKPVVEPLTRMWFVARADGVPIKEDMVDVFNQTILPGPGTSTATWPVTVPMGSAMRERAAGLIQRVWREVISNPSRKPCRARLFREFQALQGRE